MCGITGIVNFDNGKKVNPVVLKKMTDSIYHRGPDDEGFYINENVGLGFRRLSIIDLNTGHQPISNEDDSIWIVFNGEIYNYHELQENLLKQGHVLKTKTDTETVIHLYEQYGTDCLQHLRGMFAFCIWDNKKRQLFCARDRFGIKPLYYYIDKEKFVFGSEIKAILKAENVDRTISYDALDSYFAFEYITGDLSIYKNTKKLQPSHYLLLSFKEKPVFEIKRYWEIQWKPDHSRSEKNWMEEIEACFSETVKLHMISDVPLGAFLSGGIDSSSVVATMARLSSFPIKTFSIGFKEKKFNELEYAREVAKKYGCEHHEQIIEPESIHLLPKLISTYDEPFADTSAIPTYYVSKLAREFVTVALSGDGGDELFAGYSTYTQLNRYHSYFLNFNPSVNNFLWGNIHRMIPRGMKGSNISYYLSKNKSYIGAYACAWDKRERRNLFKDYSGINYENGSELYKQKILQEVDSPDFISSLQHLDITTYMVDDILTKVDRASMMNSLEVRVPLLDHKFAELTFQIPVQLKYKEGDQKYILKKAMTHYLPGSILNRSKQGFGVPVSSWFKEDLNTYVADTMNGNGCMLYDYLDKKYIQRSVLKYGKKTMRNFGKKIWSLLVFNEWLKQNQQL